MEGVAQKIKAIIQKTMAKNYFKKFTNFQESIKLAL